MKLDLSIKAKLIVTLGILVAIILFSGFNSDRSAEKQKLYLNIISHLTQADTALYTARLNQADYMITESDQFKSTFNNNIEKAVEELKSSQDLMQIVQYKQEVNTIIKDVTNYKKAFDVYINAKESNASNLQSYIDPILVSATNASKRINNLIADEIDVSESFESELFFMNKVILVVSMIISLGLGTYVFRSIMDPLNDSIRTANNIAQGKLTSRGGNITNDEFGVLNRALNVCADSLREANNEIQNSANTLYDNSAELSESLSQANNNIRTQLENIDMLVTAVEQTNCTTKEISSFAHQSSEESNSAVQAVDNGSEIVEQALVSVEQLSGSMHQSQQKVKDLNAHLQNIFGVLNSIKSISEQTNLLALNAAIEAARAGEQGRGFAVVADEVRSLSVRTQNSLEEATAIVSEINKGATEVVSAIESSTRLGENVQQLTSQSGETYKAIAQTISVMCDFNVQVATGTEEQTSVVSEINENLNQIHEMASDNTKMIANVNDVFERQTQLASSLKQLTERYEV